MPVAALLHTLAAKQRNSPGKMPALKSADMAMMDGWPAGSAPTQPADQPHSSMQGIIELEAMGTTRLLEQTAGLAEKEQRRLVCDARLSAAATTLCDKLVEAQRI